MCELLDAPHKVSHRTGRTRVQLVVGTVGRFLAVEVLLLLAAVSPSLANPWDDFKERASEAGITPTLVYDGTVAANLAGGAKNGVAFAGAMQMQFLGDGARMADARGLTVYLDILNTHGGYLNMDAPTLHNLKQRRLSEGVRPMRLTWQFVNDSGNYLCDQSRYCPIIFTYRTNLAVNVTRVNGLAGGTNLRGCDRSQS